MRQGTQLIVDASTVGDFVQWVGVKKSEIKNAFDNVNASCFETRTYDGALAKVQAPNFESAETPVPGPFMNNFVYIDVRNSLHEVWGFGTSLTDAAIEQLETMPPELAEAVLALQLDLQNLRRVRVPIGSCDFRPAGEPYSFVREGALEIPDSLDHDVHWQFWERNFQFNEAEVKRARWLIKMRAHGALHITAAPWSAPPAFKVHASNAEPQGWVGGELDSEERPQVLVSWVNYLLHYVVRYAREFGLTVQSLSLQNEPRRLPNVFAQTWETMFFSNVGLAKMTAMAIDRIRALDLKVRLVLFDDQKALLPGWIAPIMEEKSVAQEVARGKAGLVEAIGFHGYMWPEGSLNSLKQTKQLHPTAPLVCTEFTTGFSKLLSWPIGPSGQNSAGHARQIIGNTMYDLQSGSSGFIDWNMVLDNHGGPNWSGNNCDALILFNKEDPHLVVQLACLFLAHIAAFAPPGSKVVDCVSAGRSAPQAVAFQVGKKLVVVVNNTKAWFSVAHFNLVVNGRFMRCSIAKGAVQTYII